MTLLRWDTWKTQEPPPGHSSTRHPGFLPQFALSLSPVHIVHFPSATASEALITCLQTHKNPTLFHSAGLPVPSINLCPLFVFGDCCRKLEGLEKGVQRSTAMATTEQTQQTQQSPKQLERKAAAKEEIVNATSGAREIVDHAAYNARAVGKLLLHPFNKEANQEAIAKAREDKAASGKKMAAIREVGAQQADALRLSARGMNAPEQPQPGMEGPDGTAATEGAAAAAAAPAVEDHRENL